MFVPTPIVLIYHFSLMYFIEWRSSLFCSVVAELCLYALKSFFPSAELVEPADLTHYFEIIMDLVESGVLLSLRSGIQAFLSDVGMLSDFEGSHLDYRQACLPYHCSVEVDWDYEACVWWFPYTRLSGKVLGILAG